MVWCRTPIVSAIAPYRFKFSQPWLTKRAIIASHGHGGWAYRAIWSLTMSRFRGFTVGDSPGELHIASCRSVHRCNTFPLRVSSFINTRIWNACPVQTAARTTLNCRIAFPPHEFRRSLVYFAVLDLVSSCNRDFCPVQAYATHKSVYSQRNRTQKLFE